MTDPGLCGRCAHARVVISGRGSRFYLCGLSRSDPRFPRYPRLPVLRCSGHTAGTPEGSGAAVPGRGRNAAGPEAAGPERSPAQEEEPEQERDA